MRERKAVLDTRVAWGSEPSTRWLTQCRLGVLNRTMYGYMVEPLWGMYSQGDTDGILEFLDNESPSPFWERYIKKSFSPEDLKYDKRIPIRGIVDALNAGYIGTETFTPQSGWTVDGVPLSLENQEWYKLAVNMLVMKKLHSISGSMNCRGYMSDESTFTFHFKGSLDNSVIVDVENLAVKAYRGATKTEVLSAFTAAVTVFWREEFDNLLYWDRNLDGSRTIGELYDDFTNMGVETVTKEKLTYRDGRVAELGNLTFIQTGDVYLPVLNGSDRNPYLILAKILGSKIKEQV